MRVRTVVFVLTAGAALAACSSSSKSGISSTTVRPAARKRPSFTIVAHDFYYEMPATVPSGYVDVTLKNDGKSEHQAQIVRLGTMSLADFANVSIKPDIVAVKPGTVFVGGPNDAVPGKSTTTTLKLDPGKYAVLCYIPGADGKPHVAKGMLREFEAKPESSSVDTAPSAASTILLGDFSYTLPAHFTGRGVVDVSNQGAETHELNLFKMAPGVTLQQAEQALLATTPLPGPPRVTAVTGVVGLSPTQHAYLNLDLTPGNYLMFCVFPDPKKGNAPHFVEGMYKVFTIT